MEEMASVTARMEARIRKSRAEWERRRRESPDTVCSVYTAECSKVLGLFHRPFIYNRLSGGFMDDEEKIRFGFEESCPCIEKAKRALGKARIRKAVTDAVSRFGNLPSKQAQEMTFESYFDNPDWRDDESEIAYRAWLYCQGYADDPRNTPFLTLHGAYGAGKTHLAMAIAQRAALQVIWANCNELFSYLKTRFRIDFDEEVERIRKSELLVLDDLGANRGTPWQNEVLYGIINHRHAERMPTVITTNHNPYGESPLDGRLVTRIGDMRRGWVFHLNIQDNRLMLVRRDYREWPER